MKIYNMEQNSKEWYDIRKLKFTASHASTIMANGKGLVTLVKNMLAEYYSSGEFEEYCNSYSNKDIHRGKEFEDKARTIYEFTTDNTVTEVGFVELDTYIGCSPDGLVNEDGLIEIKNHNDTVFLELISTGKIDKKYLDQMQFQMYVTGRKWCDYFGFNPNFRPSYFKKRIYPDYEKYELIKEGLKSGIKMLIEKKIELDRKLSKGD